MPLPKEGTQFPPADWTPAFDQFALNSLLWSGEIDAVSNGGAASRGDDPRSHVNKPQNVWAKLIARFQFWSKAQPVDGEQRTRIHGPLATNLATLSADVLMSSTPETRLLSGGKSVKGPAQQRADLILNGDDHFMKLIEGAELASGLSGVVLTANWDRDRSDKPWMDVTPCDAAIPEYVLGHLFAVNLWTTHEQRTVAGFHESVLYHVERHESGKITHALYQGTETHIGKLVPLDTIDATAGILGIRGITRNDDETVTIQTGIQSLTAQYWRNLPTRRFRKDGPLARVGRADTEGLESLLDQYDMVWSAWMRDIKLARARLIVPEAYTEMVGSNGRRTFDDEQEVTMALAYTEAGDDTIRAEQFDIRSEQHSMALLGLTKEILQGAGWSMSSYNGEGGGGTKTATEVNDDTSTTERTYKKKALYYKKSGVAMNRALLELDAVHYRGKGIGDADLVDVVFEDMSNMDPEKEARIVSGWHAAESATVETRVRFLHPDWDDIQIAKERDQIFLEFGIGAEEDPAESGRPDGELDPNAASAVDDDEADTGDDARVTDTAAA